MSNKKPGVISRLSQFFFKISNVKIGIIATALFSGYLLFLSFLGKSFEVGEGKVNSLGTTFGFGVDDVRDFFTARSDKMITSYIEFNQVWDFIFAIIYGVMYVIWLSIIYKSYSKKNWLVNLIPLIQVIFDWVENFSIASLARTYLFDGTISTSTVTLASTSSIFKWVVSIFVYILILYGIVLRLLKAKKNKNHN